MSEQEAVTTFWHCFSVGRYRCEFKALLLAGTVTALNLVWHPHLPRRLSPVLMREYQQKRDRVLTALAETIGGCAIILDHNGATTIHPDGRIETITTGDD